MKRKITVILMTIAMVLTLCSCGGSSGESDEGMALESALIDNNYQGVLDIVEMDSKYASMDIDGETPLGEAAYNGNLELCRYLIEKGAEPEGAVLFDVENVDVIEYLIENGADLNAKEDGTTVLGSLISSMTVFTEDEYGDAADTLLAAGAEIDDESFKYLLEGAADCSRVQELVSEYGYGDDIDDTLKSAILGDSEALTKVESAPEESGLIAQYAAAFCTLDAIKHLEDAGFDFAYTDDMGCNGTAAIAAEYNKDCKVAEYLLEKYGEDSAESDLDCSLGLYGIAVAAGNFDAADNLEKDYKDIWEACTVCGADGSMDYLINSGYVPDDKEIKEAFTDGNESCLEYLMSNDSYIEILKNSSASAQDQAICNADRRNSEWSSSLFEKGVKPGKDSLEQIMDSRNIELGKKIADKYEDTDLIYDEFVAAINHGCMDIIEYITEKGIDLNKTIKDKDLDPSEFNLIHIAAGCPSTTVLQYLIDNGAETDVEDGYGDTPDIWAEDMELAMNLKLLEEQ